METSENKKLHGIYNTEMELQAEMDRLRTQGYGEEDMYIVSNHNQQLSMYRGSSSYDNDAKEGSWWDRFKAFIMGEDLVRDKYFTQMGLTEDERNRYYKDLQEGKYLLYVDKDYGTYFDEGTDSYGVNKTEEERLALHEEELLQRERNDIHNTSTNLDESLNRTNRQY
ncbi:MULTISPECIES: general stress protein [unclassified Solibacillus]|uniref:general stress protein n=1 Tax=unclassified Solibacillus TaxID=2637870 RepID=UPI0030FA3AC6